MEPNAKLDDLEDQLLLPNGNERKGCSQFQKRIQNGKVRFLFASAVLVIFLMMYAPIHGNQRLISSGDGAAPPPNESNRGAPIGFQAHSFNDLRQWESLYLKGARSFKLDPHFVRGDGSFRNRTKIVFTHNTPIIGAGRIQYDGFDDLYKELSPSGGIGSWLRADETKIIVQLCFKAAPTFDCNSTHAKRRSVEERAWLAIVDDFYERVESSSFIEDHVEFLLDGGGKPSGCLKNEWKKWKSVWISGDSLSPSSAFTNGESTDQADNSRFIMLNNPVGMAVWQKFASSNFGRFASLPYPYQLWEPDDQAQIHQYAEIFFESTPYHHPGFVFVSNSDPAMISLHSGVQPTFNKPVLVDPALRCPLGIYASKSLVVTVYAMASGEIKTAVFLKDFNMQLVQTVGDVSRVERQWTRFNPSEKAGFAVLSDENGVFSKVNIRQSDGQFTTVIQEAQAPLPLRDSNESTKNTCLGVRSFDMGHRHGEEEFVVLWAIAPPTPMPTARPSGAYTRSPTLMPATSRSPTLAPADSETSDEENDEIPCALMAIRFVYHPPPMPHWWRRHADAGKNSTDIINYICLSRRIVPIDGDIVRVSTEMFGVVFADNSKQVYSTYWSGERNHTGIKDRVKVIGVGSSPRFAASSSAIDAKDSLIALVLGDSFCSNNLDYNRRAGPSMLCDTKPTSMRAVMTYTIGASKDWVDLFKRPERKKLSACDSHLLHGAFDIGTCPSVAVTIMNAYKGEAEFLSIHRTVDDLRLLERTCALPKWTNSLVLNKLPLFYDPHVFFHRNHGVRMIKR